MKSFLHVGCGGATKKNTTPEFAGDGWKEIRFDINPDVQPDIVGSMTDMSTVASESVDAIYSSHNIEHLYPHEVLVTLKEFLRVLKPDGYVVVTCPDLQSVCKLVAEDKLTETAYVAPAGPIAPLDILYGHRASMARGNLFMAHRTGFTQKTLIAALKEAGFANVICLRREENFDLWAIASKCNRSQDELIQLAALHFPVKVSSNSEERPNRMLNKCSVKKLRTPTFIESTTSNETPPAMSQPEQVLNFFCPVFWGVKDPETFADLMRIAAKQTTAYHFADNMFVFQRNNSMLHDQPFMASWEKNAVSTSDKAIIWRRYIKAIAGFHCSHLEGDFVECGAYQGTGAKTVIDYLGGGRFPKDFLALRYVRAQRTDGQPRHAGAWAAAV